MRLLLFGASGLVGRHVLAQALADPDIPTVTAPGRRVLPARARLATPVIDFEALPDDAPWWGADAVICALGTTMRAAGSRVAFRRVDHDYPLAVARLALAHGTPAFVLNSAAGAGAGSPFFYSRVKGEVEESIAALGFPSLTIVRPGLIGGERDEHRPAERMAGVVLGWLGPVLPRSWRINPAARIAAAMLGAAREARTGRHVIASGELA